MLVNNQNINDLRMEYEKHVSAFLHFGFCRKKLKFGEVNWCRKKLKSESPESKTEKMQLKIKSRQKAETIFPPFFNIKPMINRDIQKYFFRQFPSFRNFFFAAIFRPNQTACRALDVYQTCFFRGWWAHILLKYSFHSDQHNCLISPRQSVCQRIRDKACYQSELRA